MRTPGFLLALALAACGRRDAPTVRRDPAPPAPKSAEPPPAPKLPIDRVGGDVVGAFRARSNDVVVAEPIVISFDAHPVKGRLSVFIGGDQRNAAGFPMRVAVKVERGGAVVCDSVEKPALMSFGGIGSGRSFAPGETLHESFVLNPACPALATPGDYVVTLHRKLAPDGLTITKPGAKYPTSCDVFPLHEGPLPSAYGADCAPKVASLPWVTTELALRVRPFDAKVLRREVEAALDEAKKADDANATWRLESFLCGWVSCACAGSPSTFDPTRLPTTAPSTLAGGCKGP